MSKWQITYEVFSKYIQPHMRKKISSLKWFLILVSFEVVLLRCHIFSHFFHCWKYFTLTSFATATTWIETDVLSEVTKKNIHVTVLVLCSTKSYNSSFKFFFKKNMIRCFLNRPQAYKLTMKEVNFFSYQFINSFKIQYLRL